MNVRTWSGTNGPMVRTVSGQVTRIGPDSNRPEKSGPTYPPPAKRAVGGSGPFQIIDGNTSKPYRSQNESDNDYPGDEPTDEELWLEDVARQVEADARPLFAYALAHLFRRALELDQDESS